MDGIVTIKNFDIKNLTLGEVIKSKNGGKLMRISYKGKPFRLQTEEMAVPFDITNFQDDGSDKVTKSVVCSLDGISTNPKMKLFADTLRDIDDKVIRTVATQSSELMGKEMSLEVLKEFFRPTVKDPKDPKYAPLIKIKIAPLSQLTGEMPRVFNADRTKTDVDCITKGCSVKLIISMPYVYFVNKNFGLTAKMFQACITKPSDRALNPDNYVFCDDDDVEDAPSTSPDVADFADDDF